jgi:hypothetical protein
VGYDDWLMSGDPVNSQFLCPVCGDDSAETDEIRGDVPDPPVPGCYELERKLECGCWIPETAQYDSYLGWL